MEDRRISARSIDLYMGISGQNVSAIINDDFEMRKLAAKCIPKILTTERKNKCAKTTGGYTATFPKKSFIFPA